MPHISMRMSASSSTTRMSCAMDRCLRSRARRFGRRRGTAIVAAMEDEHYARATSLAILQDEFAAMIFHDLLDDGETETGALAARRHVRLGQALASFRRETATVVLDDERSLARRLDDADDDPAGQRLAVPRLNGFRGVLQEIDHRLAHLTRIAGEAEALRNVEGYRDLGRSGALQERRLSHDLHEVLLLHDGRGHARKGRELVHHAADIAHMADDRVRARGEGIGIIANFAQILALQAFGRELNRRQRILDLMRDAPRHVRPGRLALRRDQLCDVVEGHDKALDLTLLALGGDAHEEGLSSAAAHHLELRLRESLRPARRFLKKWRHL